MLCARDHCSNDESDVFLTRRSKWLTLGLITGSMGAVTIALALVLRMKRLDVLTFFAVTLFCQQAKPTEDDEKLSQKSVFIIAIFAGMVIFTIFSADLAAKIAAKKCAVDGIDGLFDPANGFTMIKSNTQVSGKSPTWVKFFSHFDRFEPYKEFIEGCTKCWRETGFGGTATALREVLFSGEKTFLITTESFVRRHLRDFNYLKGRLIEFPYKDYEPLELGIPFHVGMSLVKANVSNMAHLKLKESGIFDKIMQHVNPKHALGRLITNTSFQPAALLQVEWAFLIYAFGAAAACIIGLVEILIEKSFQLKVNNRSESNQTMIPDPEDHLQPHCHTCTCQY